MSKKIRILHIETGKNLYGGAKQVLYLIRGLVEKNFGEHILVCSKENPIYTHLQGKITLYAENIRGELDVLFLRKLLSIVAKEHPHILHIHSRRGADLWGWIVGRILNVPIIITRRVDNPELALWARIKYNRCTRVITISHGIEKVLKREGVNEKKLSCIPSAVDTQEYKPTCHNTWFLKEFSLSKGNTVVGMIAQFIPRKGHHLILEIASHLTPRYPNTIFLLFGKGKLREEIKKEIKKRHLQEKVRICGFRKDMPRIIPCLDILIHPAYMEGLGVSLLQASACEVPIIASRVGGIPEIVRNGENGILVEAGNWKGFSQATEMLLKNKEIRIQMGKKGREIVKKYFSIPAMVDKYIKIYKETLEERQ